MRTTLLALTFTIVALLLGYLAFGPWTMLVFAGGFAGGFLLWLVVPAVASFGDIKNPYWLTLAAFVLLHRVEENVTGFQVELSKLTGNPVPALTSPGLIGLLVVSVGGWLLVPILVPRRIAFGNYLAWTFFASMGITELAHFVFPLVRGGGYAYFPGMASVPILAPLAWWGMYRLSRPSLRTSRHRPGS
jgi:hypothetical protein